MPRGGKKGHKGRGKQFSNPEEIDRQMRLEREKVSLWEEIEKQKAKERYMKLHLEGKTEQARADLARLAIIKKQREEAARKREELRKVKEEAEAKSKR
nr:PREDICTED: 28 kDa heat- and acid-stable phosphoprotein-like [Lepisosteus oculatus]